MSHDVICAVSAVNRLERTLTAETQSSQRFRRENLYLA